MFILSKPLQGYSVCHLFSYFLLLQFNATTWAFLCLQITMHIYKACISNANSGAAPRGRWGFETAQSNQGGDLGHSGPAS